MKMGSAAGPQGRRLLRGGGERRVDRISDLRVCCGRGSFSTQVSRAKRCADRCFPRSLASVGGEGMRSYWPLHATRQVHDDDQLAGYTWILLAGVRDRNVVTVASATLLVPSLDGRVSPSGVPTPGGCRLVQAGEQVGPP